MLIEIKHSKDDPDWFWTRMGRFFASPAIRKELGLAMSDSPTHCWTIALESESQVVMGFAAITHPSGIKKVSHLVHAYTLPAFRGRGVYSALLKERIWVARDSHFDTRTLRATCTSLSRGALERAGFGQVASRGRYAVMELEVRR